MEGDLASISGRRLAEATLARLLDRCEARIARARDRGDDETGLGNRISEKLPEVSLLSEEKDELERVLTEAAERGAVQLVKGRHELRDHIVRVVLLDPEPLYALLGRPKPSEVAQKAGDALAAKIADLEPEIRILGERIAAAWAVKRNLVRDLGPDDAEAAALVLRAASALLARQRVNATDDGMDLRTFSRRATGNSKFVEGNIGRIADVLRMASEVPDYLDAAEVLAQHGLRKFPHACLIAGPISYRGVRLPTEPYIGLAPEMTGGLGVLGRPRWMLTIENLASFNRQVREAVEPDGIVIYTGGFPSGATLDAIIRLAQMTDCPILHWGDIDAGGIRIAYRIEKALSGIGRRLGLHLMTPELALRHGIPEPPSAVLKTRIDPRSCVAELVAFLHSRKARKLEQEELDPVVPALP